MGWDMGGLEDVGGFWEYVGGFLEDVGGLFDEKFRGFSNVFVRFLERR